MGVGGVRRALPLQNEDNLLQYCFVNIYIQYSLTKYGFEVLQKSSSDFHLHFTHRPCPTPVWYIVSSIKTSLLFMRIYVPPFHPFIWTSHSWG